MEQQTFITRISDLERETAVLENRLHNMENRQEAFEKSHTELITKLDKQADDVVSMKLVIARWSGGIAVLILGVELVKYFFSKH